MDKFEIKIDERLLQRLYGKAAEIYKKNKINGEKFHESVRKAINEIGLPSQEKEVRKKYFLELMRMGRQRAAEVAEAIESRAAEAERWKKYNR